MSAIAPLAMSGLGLAGIYFLLASGLSLIYGLMRVLNLAHGAVFCVGAYLGWGVMRWDAVGNLWVRLVVAAVISTLGCALLGVIIERGLLARLYGRPMAQMLVTLGLGFAITAAITGWYSPNSQKMTLPNWLLGATDMLGGRVANSRILIVIVAVVIFAVTLLFVRRSTHGLIIRAGVENRQMVTALGIDVHRSFTLLFAIGSGLAGVGGLLAGVFFGSVTPSIGTSQLIFAFIVVIIGGLGSLEGTAISAVVVALLQQFVNYYGPAGAGDLVAAALLVLVLLARPRGLLGKVEA